MTHLSSLPSSTSTLAMSSLDGKIIDNQVGSSISGGRRRRKSSRRGGSMKRKNSRRHTKKRSSRR